MSISTLSSFGRARLEAGANWNLAALTSALLLALIGIELAVLVAVLPETAEAWWYANRTGDFGNFFNDARNLDVNGLYSPGLSLIMYPLTPLGIENAYRVYLALGAAAALGVAYLAQRAVSAPEARIAVALGVISIPQLHWALRLGHMTPFLALAALGGFLLLRRRPLLAGLCLAVLVLKPQYAVIPGLYLLWTRNGRALAGMLAGALVIEVAGFAAVGFDAIGPYLAGFFDIGADARDNLLPYQLSWQYAWQGFLISIGIEPNPLVAFDLSILCLGAVVLVWAKAKTSVALTAAALGMLLVTPYSNFYDWALLAVAGALLLRADVSWKPALPVIAVGLYAALLATQAATPFPAVDLELGVIAADGAISVLPSSYVFPTKGIYWVTPAALAVVGFLALAGRRRKAQPGAGATGTESLPEPRSGLLQRAGWVAMAGLLIPAAYFGAAFLGHAPPFTQTFDPFSRSEVMKQVPADFPLPQDTELQAAGAGDELPYRIEWSTTEPVSEVAGIYRSLLEQEDWELMLDEQSTDGYRIRLAHFTPYGFMTHWAMLDVSPGPAGTRIALDLFVTQMITFTTGGDDEP